MQSKKPKKWSLARWCQFRSKLTKARDNLTLLAKLSLHYHRSGEYVPGWLWDSIEKAKQEAKRLSERKKKQQERQLKKIRLTSQNSEL